MIRHSLVGKPTEIIIEKSIVSNLDKIKKAIF
jgi:hypothetical protein